ncbi:DeoR/GlpR family DNA-binding transcription regulator [Christensenella intestinihominis]|uniref:DeoR/GlpR family DNA-binding transcription regulator n=1 Tax=Christensenella intestinihominis TaxID=1851429 RepID=UPI0008335725|nr:DeoR/GlpR family DNA-binding transcription regulator [Christensenella intestinihominis]
MLAVERKSKIIDLLEAKGQAEVSELAQMLSVVPETIRRDLKELEMQGVLQRTHGGAVLAEKKEVDTLHSLRIKQHYKEKIKLCKKAAEFIEEGDTIFVDNSTTLLNLVRFINPEFSVTLLTNSVDVLQLASTLDNQVTVISSGGVLHREKMYLAGSIADYMHTEFIPSKAFISCYGVSLEYGLSDCSMNEAAFKKNMMQVSQKTFCIVDHTKFEKNGPVKLTGIDACDVLITDKRLEPRYQEMLQSDNVIMDIFHCEENNK